MAEEGALQGSSRRSWFGPLIRKSAPRQRVDVGLKADLKLTSRGAVMTKMPL